MLGMRTPAGDTGGPTSRSFAPIEEGYLALFANGFNGKLPPFARVEIPNDEDWLQIGKFKVYKLKVWKSKVCKLKIRRLQIASILEPSNRP
jgi:hypothetical protein